MLRSVLLCIFSLQGILLINFLLPLTAAADELKLRTEFEYSNSESDTTNKETGVSENGNSSRFVQLYNLDLSKTIYPNLTFNGGALFESDSSESTSDEQVSTREEETFRPHIALDLRTGIYEMGAGFRKTRITEEISSLPGTSNFQEDMKAHFKWRPAGLPVIRFFFDSVNNYDDIGSNDMTDESMTLKMNYTVLKKHPLNYTYSRNEAENRITGYNSIVQAHEGRAGYARSFFNRRLSMDVNYSIKHRTTELPGSENVTSSSLSPVSGLYSADDTPQGGPELPVLTALIDGDKTASTGINLGWSVSDESARNIGLDFGVPVSIDKIYIYVDKRLNSAASGSISWSVYTSPDNTDTSVWTLHSTVAPAAFGIFQNRFELSFPEVTSRYIKVVADPLSSAFIIESELEDVYVTEVETFVSTTSAADTEDITSVDHKAGFNLVGRPTGKAVLGYNFFYTLKETDPSLERSTMSNGVYINYAFNKMFSLITRVSHDENETTLDSVAEKTVTDVYSAMLKAAYLKTFEQMLSYSSSEQQTEDSKSTVQTVFLRNNANLYRGWDAFLDIGHTQSEALDGGETTTETLRLGTNLVPNDKIDFDVTYTLTKADKTDENSTASSTSSEEMDFRTLFYPYRTLTFFANLNMKDSDTQDERKVFQNYSLGWSPFPDGDLQLFFTYNESIRSADDRQETTLGPSLRWNISRYAKLNIFYYLTEEETVLQTREASTFKMTFTLTF